MFTVSFLLLAAADPGLTAVKKICVDRFGAGAPMTEARELAIAALFATKRFAVTEDCDKADAILRGAASERSNQRARSEGDSTSTRRGAVGAARDVIGAASQGLSDSERLFSSEMQRHASVTLRLVNPAGDILWAHSTDSTGGKTRSALADAVDRAVRQLVKDVEKPAAPKP